MTMNMAAELASDRIRVACVRPGSVATPIYTGSEERRVELARQVPLGRVGRPEEVACWLDHIVATESEWVTGTLVSVDGARVLTPPETG